MRKLMIKWFTFLTQLLCEHELHSVAIREDNEHYEYYMICYFCGKEAA